MRAGPHPIPAQLSQRGTVADRPARGFLAPVLLSPRAEGEMPYTLSAAATIEAPEPKPLATVRVLVVDADPAQLRSVLRWLDSQPRVRTDGFVCAEEALTHGTRGEYDVCLIDERLDGWSGVMLGAMIGALNPEARLILMSASRHPRVERQAKEHGFHAVVGKPVQLRLLNETILAAVGDHGC